MSVEQLEIVQSRIAELKHSLQQQIPGYEKLLHTIHRALQSDPETVTLLTEEQIGVICAGLSKRTDVKIATGAGTKGRLPSGKKLKDIDLDDII